MFDYDATLKLLLKGPATLTIQIISNLIVTRWLNVELNTVEERRVDLLGESDDGRLLHIELQSDNDPDMPLRMMEYGAKIGLELKRYPTQVVLYIGKDPLRMSGDYAPNGVLVFRYKVVDIRDLDGKQLLESDGIGDNVLAILTRPGDEREAVRQIVGKIAHLDESERQSRLDQLAILAGLRRLGTLVEEERNRMPITASLADHDLFGPVYTKGLQDGLHQGELTVIRRQITKRFGPIPAWLDERLAHTSASELEELSDRVLDAQSLEDLTK
jgi:hypothetical protein